MSSNKRKNIIDSLTVIMIYENYIKVVTKYNSKYNNEFILENNNEKIKNITDFIIHYLFNDIISIRTGFELNSNS